MDDLIVPIEIYEIDRRMTMMALHYDEDDACFSSSHLSGSDGNVAAASASSGNGDAVNGFKSEFETPSIHR